MSFKSSRVLAIVIVGGLIATAFNASARSIRVDSGDWDSTGFISGSANANFGFNIDFQGVSTSSAIISDTGRVDLSGGGETAALLPFFEPGQAGSTSFQYATTNANFNQAGIDAGFRVTWQSFDVLGALANEFQMSLFDFSDGTLALEFNYNMLTFGDDASAVGFTSSAGDSFDLLAALGLTFTDYMGIGNDEFTTNCAQGTSALACNNYFGNSGAFGPDASILPGVLGGYFRQIDTNGGTAQGRYVWLFGATANVAEPTSIWLLTVGAVLLVGRKRLLR